MHGSWNVDQEDMKTIIIEINTQDSQLINDLIKRIDFDLRSRNLPVNSMRMIDMPNDVQLVAVMKPYTSQDSYTGNRGQSENVAECNAT